MTYEEEFPLNVTVTSERFARTKNVGKIRNNHDLLAYTALQKKHVCEQFVYVSCHRRNDGCGNVNKCDDVIDPNVWTSTHVGVD